MNCPSCKTVSLSMSERNGIEIDFCPECRGVWLDRGELDKIIEKTAATMNVHVPQADHHQAQQHNMPNPFGKQNDYYKYKRKKSFLEEIFD
jgi:Zn-finger nucleic acid-binding protein